MSSDTLPSYVFRNELRPTDGERVRAIVDATGMFRSDEVEIAVELVDERLRRGDESGYYFVIAEQDGEMVGYACYGPIPCTIGSYDLYWIAVAPSCQGRGLGRQLVERVEQAIRRADGRQVYIDTSGRAQYQPTQAFYARCGYQLAAKLDDFYAPGDSKYIYCKRLT